MVIILEDVKLDFSDVLIRPKRSTLSSRSEVDLHRAFQCRWSKKEWTGVPIIAANMDTVGTFAMSRALAANHMFTALHKFYTAEDFRKELAEHPENAPYLAVSSGTSEADLAVMREVINTTSISTICLDVANGYSEHFVNCIRKVRDEFPNVTIMAGNVCTAEMTEELILSGADAVKVGIGPGSVCTTRRQTGVGYPQLSAIIECADAAHGLNGLVIADGGCVVPGDVAKAFAAGADFTMLGSFFAAHEESAGELIERDGKKYKLFYGMSSATAMQKYKGGVAEYRSSEGKTVEVPYRGPVQATVNDLLGGVRSTCTYVGASKLKELSKRTTFVRVARQLNTVYGNP